MIVTSIGGKKDEYEDELSFDKVLTPYKGIADATKLAEKLK